MAGIGIHLTTIVPHLACHYINGAIIARPGPHLANILFTRSEIDQKCRLDARSGPDLSVIDLGHIHLTTIGPHLACHNINGAITARPGPHLANILFAMPDVGQRCRLDGGSGPTRLLCGVVPETATLGWLQKHSIPIKPDVKMPNFTAEINMLTVHKNVTVQDKCTSSEFLYKSHSNFIKASSYA